MTTIVRHASPTTEPVSPGAKPTGYVCPGCGARPALPNRPQRRAMARQGVATTASEAVIFHQANCPGETQTLRAHMAAGRNLGADLAICRKTVRRG